MMLCLILAATVSLAFHDRLTAKSWQPPALKASDFVNGQTLHVDGGLLAAL